MMPKSQYAPYPGGGRGLHPIAYNLCLESSASARSLFYTSPLGVGFGRRPFIGRIDTLTTELSLFRGVWKPRRELKIAALETYMIGLAA
jgi:hypothetical protein